MATSAHVNSADSSTVPGALSGSLAGETETAHKMLALEAQLRQLGSLMVAYSGGVDSAFLAATAHRILGSNMLAVMADSPSLARRDLEQATAFAQALEIPLHIIATEELDRPNTRAMTPTAASIAKTSSLSPWNRSERSWVTRTSPTG